MVNNEFWSFEQWVIESLWQFVRDQADSLGLRGIDRIDFFCGFKLDPDIEI